MTESTTPANHLSTRMATEPRQSFMPGVLGTALLELSLTLRAPGFWLVQVAVLASGLLVLVPDAFAGTYLRFSSQQLRELTAFTLLLMPLLALPGLRRLQGPRGDVVLATTHDSVAHGLGTILGTFCWLIPATILQLLARWLMGEVLGGQANWTLLAHAPFLSLASLTLGLGILACLTLVWTRILPILLIWLGLWVLVLQGAGGLFGGFVGPYMPLLNPWNVFWEGLLLSPAVGLGMARRLVTWQAGWLAAVGITMLFAWLVLAPVADARRANRRRWLPAACLLAALAWAVLSQVGFQREVTAQQPAMTPRTAELDAWEVVESDLDVSINPQGVSRIEGTADMVMRSTGDNLPEVLILRLRPGMHLNAESKSGPLAVTRQGDSVLIGLDDREVTLGSLLDIRLEFAGSPEWPYSDHRFQTGGAFPAIDSNQPITGVIVDNAGFLLRDGDWRPWPWTTGPQTATVRDHVTIRGAGGVTSHDANAPQLLAAVMPVAAGNVGQIRSGTDPSAGLRTALQNVAAGAERLWDLLGETGAPDVIALPYLPDAYANSYSIVIPEAYDLSHDLQVGAAYQRNLPPQLVARSGYVLAARAWLNGNARHPRAYGEATLTRDALASFSGSGPRAGEAYRLLQISSLGPIGPRWSELWLGTDPGDYLVNPFALWLGIELADAEVRVADLALLRSLSGDTQDHFRLRQRGLPWNLTRQLQTVATTVALADWADSIGQEQALGHFARAFMTATSQDHETLLATLETMSGMPLDPVASGGTQ